jgi:hypothetical protein
MLVFDDSDTPHNWQRIEKLAGDLRNHIPQAPIDGPLVRDARASLFAHPDHDHFREAALDGAVVVRVWLHAIDRNDGVGCGGMTISHDWNAAVRRLTDLDDIHT